MKSIQLSKRSTIKVPDITSYKLVVEAINPQNMSGKIFINQRIHNYAKGNTEDFFVAVCTPSQLEDLAEDSPEEGTSYFRTDKIELVARTPEILQEVFDSLLYETKKLVVDLTDLDNLTEAEIYTVNAIDPITLE
jgi:hypothetical protein